MNNKQKVFIFARKNKIDIGYVYIVLEQFKLPSTYKKCPNRKFISYLDRKGQERKQLVYNNLQKRDISESDAKSVISFLKDFKEYQKAS